jgi:hypothetical protein
LPSLARLNVSGRPIRSLLLLDRYTDESIKKIGRTKAQVLRAIKTYDIASKTCSEITSANQLIIKVTPQTVANYLSHLAAMFAVARPAWGYPLDQCTSAND